MKAIATVSIEDSFSMDFPLEFPQGTKTGDLYDIAIPILVDNILSMKVTVVQYENDSYTVSFADDEHGHFDIEDIQLDEEDIEDEIKSKVQKVISSATAFAVRMASLKIKIF